MFPSLFLRQRRGGSGALLAIACLLALTTRLATGAEPARTIGSAGEPPPTIQLGPGDSVSVQVYGQADLNATIVVADDGTIPMALVGAVNVTGLSPEAAARQIERALRDKQLLNNPQVTVAVVQSRFQRITLLGDIGRQGLYTVDSRMSIWELLAQAGGLSETAADVIFVVRAGKDESSPTRIPIDLRGLRDPKAATPIPQIVLQGGDTIFVPKAPQFYLSGQVGRPGMYRVEEKLTLEKALINAGGVTALGSERRIEVKRRNEKGVEAVTRMKLGDLVKPDDVIRVKERLF